MLKTQCIPILNLENFFPGYFYLLLTKIKKGQTELPFTQTDPESVRRLIESLVIKHTFCCQ